VGKAAHSRGIEVVGFLDGFRGLVENRYIRLDNARLSGILTLGGTILGTSRDKPHKMVMGSGEVMNMLPVAVDNYERLHLDALVCLGGNGTQKNAYRLAKEGLNILTLPKTIDNDVAGTDVTFGFDTAMSIATDAIDRLHTTADSHQRTMVVEIMGHEVGWLALGAGLAGGADVILIPEIRYEVERVVEPIQARSRRGKRFSIVAVAEGARPQGESDDHDEDDDAEEEAWHSHSLALVQRLEELAEIEVRFTALGHLQRGGTPTAYDRLLATRLGTRCAELIADDVGGVMVAVRGDDCVPVPLKEVAGELRTVPKDHPWIASGRAVGTSFGD
jgi:6-phosphofructokinase 1